MAAILFAAGGDLRWPQAWVFVAEHIVCSGAVVAWIARNDPALLRERFFFGWIVLIGLDARRYGWSHMPVALEDLGAFAFAASMVVTWSVFRANTFAVPHVRVQAQRSQRVIDSGPYRYVRHQMYSGGILFFAGMALMLGSWLGLLVVPLFVVALGARAGGEERMLRRALDDYGAYDARVRWRLVPGVW